MTKLLQRVAFALCIATLVAALGSPAKADESNKLTYFTFSAPVELPGNKVLPAGTYAFKLLDSVGDRNVVQIFNKDAQLKSQNANGQETSVQQTFGSNPANNSNNQK